jgi:hypothetical protein
MNQRDGLVLLILSLILLSPLLLPVTSSGEAVDGSIAMAEKPPDNCIPSPRAASTHSGNSPMVVGEVSMANSKGNTVRIEFSRVSDRAISEGTIQLRFGEFGNVTKTKGFTKQSSGIYNWDRSTNPWIEYRIQKNISEPNQINITRQSNQSGIVPLPAFGGAVQVAFEPAQKGYIGSRFAYLGEYETRSIQAGCQNITLVIPRHVEVISSPGQILKALNETAYRMTVGRAYHQVRFFVYSGDLGDVEGFVRGTEYSVDAGPEVIIQENATLGGPTKFSWRHESIHTRQSFRLAPELEWFREASANYFAYRTALDSGAITPREYDALLAWSYEQNYTKRLVHHSDAQVAYIWGPLVLSRLDAEMRSTPNQTLLDTFRWMNHAETDLKGISLTQFRNHTLSVGKNNTSGSPGFNLTQAITSNQPPKPAYVTGSGLVPGWARQLWFPTNFYLLKALYIFTGVLWLVLLATNIAGWLGYIEQD